MRTRTLLIGLAGGLLFFAHAMLNNSHAWPLLWPALAGLLAVWTARGDRAHSYGSDLGKAASAGLVCGLVFLGATAVTLSRMGLGTSAGLVGLAIAAVLGIVAATVAGGLVHPIARDSSRQA